MKSVLKESLCYLNLDINLIEKLEKNNINKVEELWSLTKKDLKCIGVNDQEIHQIIIRLELHGLDLGKKIVKI